MKVFKTHTFKIHNLSNSKKSKLDKSFVQSEFAFYHALKAVKHLAAPMLEQDKNDRKKALSEVKKLAAKAVKPLPFGNGIKETTIAEVAAQISSYVELTISGQNAALPDRTDSEIDYHNALTLLINSQTKEEEDIARDEMARASKERVRPISFYKYRLSDGFMILRDSKSRLFTFVNLWGAKDKRAERIVMDMHDTRTGDEFKKSSMVGLLLPLECSEWNIEALRQGNAKSAKITTDGKEYFLAVAVEYEVEAVKPVTYLGIDRGIDEIASYAVRKESGRVITSGSFGGDVLRNHQRRMEEKQKQNQRVGKRYISGWSNYSDNLMHHVANEIVRIAVEHKSQVVIENLTTITNGAHKKRKKGTRRSNFSRMLSRAQYAKLEFMLTYKLAMHGLPAPRTVHPAFTSQLCPACGHIERNNRPERDLFHCVKCSRKAHADINAAINIAGKGIHFYKIVTSKKGKQLDEKTKFQFWQSNNLSI